MPRRHPEKTHPAAHQPRPARRIHQGEAGKHSEGTVCPDCGASYRKGRWTWQRAEEGSPRQRCPACERIASAYPAGRVLVEGGFAAQHRDEIVALLRKVEERERAEHPLKRIMEIADAGSGFEATVTDGRLARSLGRALKEAYDGRLEGPPTTAETENLVRVRWTRD